MSRQHLLPGSLGRQANMEKNETHDLASLSWSGPLTEHLIAGLYFVFFSGIVADFVDLGEEDVHGEGDAVSAES
jgi:hypothetical protein